MNSNCPWLHATRRPLDPPTCGEPATHVVVYADGSEEEFCAQHAQWTAAWTFGAVVARLATAPA